MQFNELFARDINRHMDGVIKALDRSHVEEELDEYVVTPQIRNHLQRFCDAYTNPRSDANGAWISGFYGSGKSHLLKILSYLLENSEVGGKRALDYLRPQIEDEDPMLMGALEQACERTPSQSILFDVGAKSDSKDRDSGESLLNTFIKVLNEEQGYFAGAPYVADFERELDRDSLYEDFKERFRAAEPSHRSWTDARRSSNRYAHLIDTVYDEVTGQPAGTTQGLLRQRRLDFKPSPEDFAHWTREYIDRQSEEHPGFRLNFFADEMGQYIAGSEPLLLMLQNIVEQLNVVCGRRAWVVVVSQEEMDDIVGEVGRGAASEFSKIQARFGVKIKIPASDSTTVVKQRLLKKRESAAPVLDELYDASHDDFKVLLSFSDGATSYRVYEGRADFQATYPLAPYQFDLFRQGLEGLSDHHAFTGEYESTGARNLLATARTVLAEHAQDEVGRGTLIPFDALYEGLAGELKGDAVSPIDLCTNNFGEDAAQTELAVRLLKALLMVKYVKGFRGTARNLRVLLLQSLDQDTNELEQQIRETLNALEAQSYLQREGDSYEYLTNEEKDVESEIRREPVQQEDVSKQIAKLLVEDVISQCKVRYVNEGFQTTYAFDLEVDGQWAAMQRNQLKVRVRTDLSTDADMPPIQAGACELIVRLPAGSRITQDMRLWLQTNSYRAAHAGDAMTEQRKGIIEQKRAANETRRSEMVAELRRLLDGARYGTNHQDVTDQLEGAGVAKLSAAVLAMVDASYPYLHALKTSFDKQTIYAAAASTDHPLMEGEELPEYCRLVYEAIGPICAEAGTCRVGGKDGRSLVQRMAGGQYGWPSEPVRQAVGVLAVNGRVSCRRDGRPLEGADLAQALAQDIHLENVEVRFARAVSAEELAALKEACLTITGIPAEQGEARAIAETIKKDLAHRLEDARRAEQSVTTLPFAFAYQDDVAKLERYAAHERDWFVEHAAEEAQGIHGLVEEINEMASFAQGQPGALFAGARELLETKAGNLDALPACADDRAKLEELLDDPQCYRRSDAGPRAKRLTKKLQGQVEQGVADARAKAEEELKDFEGQFHGRDDYQAAPEEARGAADALFQGCRERIACTEQIPTIEKLVARFKQERGSKLYSIVAPAPEPAATAEADDTAAPAAGAEPAANPAPAARTVTYDEISHPAGWSRTLESADDVHAFVRELEQQLLEHVESGEKIIV